MWADGGFLWNVPFEYAEEWGADEIYILSVIPSRLQRADVAGHGPAGRAAHV